MTATQMPSPGHQAAPTHEPTYEQRLQTLSEEIYIAAKVINEKRLVKYSSIETALGSASAFCIMS